MTSLGAAIDSRAEGALARKPARSTVPSRRVRGAKIYASAGGPAQMRVRSPVQKFLQQDANPLHLRLTKLER
jgi:hypothetical protein